MEKNLTPLPNLIKPSPEAPDSLPGVNGCPPPGQRRGVLFEDMYRGGRGRKSRRCPNNKGRIEGGVHERRHDLSPLPAQQSHSGRGYPMVGAETGRSAPAKMPRLPGAVHHL